LTSNGNLNMQPQTPGPPANADKSTQYAQCPAPSGSW
jgi:hypothetical protein